MIKTSLSICPRSGSPSFSSVPVGVVESLRGRGRGWWLAWVLTAGLLSLSAVSAQAGVPSATTECCPTYCCGQAQLVGQVNPNGLTTTVYFQYGLNTGYGYTSTSQTLTGNTVQNVAIWIFIVPPGPANHYRIVAQNSAGTVYGKDENFAITACGPCSSEFVEALDGRVRSFGLLHGIENSLLAKLSSVRESISAGRPRAACGQVGAFINEVRAQAGKAIPSADAGQLVSVAELIRDSLGCSKER